MEGIGRDGTAEGIVGFKFQHSHSCCVVRVKGDFLHEGVLMALARYMRIGRQAISARH